jgi:hypothetical protein
LPVFPCGIFNGTCNNKAALWNGVFWVLSVAAGAVVECVVLEKRIIMGVKLTSERLYSPMAAGFVEKPGEVTADGSKSSTCSHVAGCAHVINLGETDAS